MGVPLQAFTLHSGGSGDLPCGWHTLLPSSENPSCVLEIRTTGLSIIAAILLTSYVRSTGNKARFRLPVRTLTCLRGCVDYCPIVQQIVQMQQLILRLQQRVPRPLIRLDATSIYTHIVLNHHLYKHCHLNQQIVNHFSHNLIPTPVKHAHSFHLWLAIQSSLICCFVYFVH